MTNKEKLRIAQKLDDIDRDAPMEVTAGGKVYTIKRSKQLVWAWYSRLITKAELSYSEPDDKILVKMDNNRKLIYRCVGMMLLRGPVRIKLFNWIYWRYLYATTHAEDMLVLLKEINKLNDVKDVFFCLLSLQTNNELTVMMTKENTSTILQKLQSDKETTPSQPSTAQ